MDPTEVIVPRVLKAWICSMLLLASCDQEPTRPVENSDTVILFGSEAGEVLVVRPASRSAAVERRIQIPRFRDAFALSPDSATLYFTAFEQISERKLHAFDMRGLGVTRARSIGDILGTDKTEDITDSGGFAITVSPNGFKLFIAGWRSSEGVLGVGVVDAQTFTFAGFVGPLRVRPGGLATVPAGVGLLAGGVIALGNRIELTGPSPVHLFVIDPETYEVVDSLPLHGQDTTWHKVVPAGDGRHVYLNGPYSITRYDLEARAARESVQLPTIGDLTLARDGQELYRADRVVDSETPGEGRVFILGPDLLEREPIDLSDHPDQGFPPVVLSMASSRDGEHLYVVTGTSSAGISGPFQRGRLFVVRLADRRVEGVIPLNSWGVGPPIVAP